ncbi:MULTISPECIES: glycosyltransferase [Fibrobacter]|jgi:glycosyltransferase involved in cell wall biosynthesis|uniref:Glycosyltransferase involved in cell wall bisynthesis n=1 Tax=Fibrobacter succinogenes TaxID=833 RepID=A0A380S6S1_FIBSU|nr:glycosyltransferase [Fibrobacter succinogenes]PWJ35949.1 glycosyltransferase involved in cell wall biosynthesis [Fibrobacter succinogenes subsp. elongatus]SUQ24604.1 Glycosyltransferase involved in cell wall bisynthesis [Fibrobacter succinogenes]
MKVLVIGSVYPRFQEDAEVPWLRTSIAHLKKAGVEIQVLAPAYKGLKSHDIDGTHVNRFRYAPASWEILTHEEGAPSKMASKPWLQLLAIPYIINGFFQCIRICRKWRPDVIHAHWPFPHAYIALGAAKLFKIPLVLNFHGAELLLIRKKKWVKPLLKFAIGQAQAIFANSSFTAGKIKALRNVDVEWSPYGTTLEGASLPLASAADAASATPSSGGTPQRPEPHAINNKFKILFVGRHIERKGICYLIEAAKYLPRDKFEIRIVGVGDLTEQLKQQAAAVNDGAEIIFTGKLSPEDLANEYKTANVFTLPAIVDHKGDTEGLGVVLIEAMELGLPIVASNVGGIPDVVVDGESGILVPEKDPAALADAFKRLEADPTLIQKLLAGARNRIDKCFTWDGIIERQVEVYKRLQQ